MQQSEGEFPPGWPTRDEYKEAARKGVWGQVMVRESRVSEGLLAEVPSKRVRLYHPAIAVRLIDDFASLRPGDVRNLEAFAGQWGLPGFHDLIEQRHRFSFQERAAGDPIAWIWAHARGVALVLELERLIAAGDSAGLAKCVLSLQVSKVTYDSSRSAQLALLERRWADLESLVPELWPEDVAEPYNSYDIPMCFYVVGIRESIVLSGISLPALETANGLEASDDPESYVRIGSEIIDQIVNANLVGISPVVKRTLPLYSNLDINDGPVLRQRFDTLVSAIYHQVAERLTTQDLQHCEACGLPFVRTHGNQKFCPPEEFEKRSRCEMRYQKRRMRSRKKEIDGS